MRKWLKNSITIVLFLLSFFALLQLNQMQTKAQNLRSEYAIATSVKYGLFNPEIWKEKVAVALIEKIGNLDLIGANRSQIESGIEKALESLLVIFQDKLKGKLNDQNEIVQGLVNIVLPQIIDEVKLKDQIPILTKNIVDGLDNETNLKNLNHFLKIEIEKALIKSQKNYPPELKALFDIHDVNSIQGLQSIIKLKLSRTEQIEIPLIIITFILGIVLFLWNYFQYYQPFIISYLGLLIFWIPGIFFPLMTVGAALDKVTFDIMDITFSFDNQTLFYNSKSIIGLVKTLFAQADASSWVVGVLVMTFSIVFPLLKITLTLIFKKRNSKNRFFQYIITHGGKWSMADVFVVAIFMGYIGFKSVVAHQLSSLEGATEYADLITTDLTQLHYPTLFFLTFVILNMIISLKLNKT